MHPGWILCFLFSDNGQVHGFSGGEGVYDTISFVVRQGSPISVRASYYLFRFAECMSLVCVGGAVFVHLSRSNRATVLYLLVMVCSPVMAPIATGLTGSGLSAAEEWPWRGCSSTVGGCSRGCGGV